MEEEEDDGDEIHGILQLISFQILLYHYFVNSIILRITKWNSDSNY